MKFKRGLRPGKPAISESFWGYTLNVSGPTSYTNQIGNATLYGYNAMNHKTNEVSVGVTTLLIIQ